MQRHSRSIIHIVLMLFLTASLFAPMFAFGETPIDVSGTNAATDSTMPSNPFDLYFPEQEDVKEDVSTSEIPTEPETQAAPYANTEFSNGVTSAEADDSDLQVSVSWETSAKIPQSTDLRIDEIDREELSRLDSALDEVRSPDSVVYRYVVDLSLVDSSNGDSVEPADTVNLTFSPSREIDPNLEYHIYHAEDGNITELETTTSEEGLSADTDGFSPYIVEFSLKDRSYVIEPTDIVTLYDILDNVGLVGQPESWAVSNPELFDITVDEGVPYLDSYAPFSTEEWLDVTINGITHRINVTDDQVAINHGNTVVDIEGVHQGEIDNFTATMPVASIWIDESKINMTASSRNAAQWGRMNGNDFLPETLGPATTNHPGFVVEDTGSDNGTGSSGYKGRRFLIFDTTLEALSYSTDGNSGPSQINDFPGEVITYKWTDGAKKQHADGSFENLDVYVTYSDLMITLEKGVGTGVVGQLGLFSGNVLTLGKSGDSNQRGRYAYHVDINVVVRDKAGNIVEGTYYYPMVDIDVGRTATNGNPNTNYSNFYGTNRFNAATYDPELHGYSEQVKLLENFGDIYIPGANGVHGETTAANYTNTAYLSQIKRYDDGTYLIYPADGGSQGTQGSGDTNTFYTGFATLADNTAGGIKLRYYGSSGTGKTSMETNILSGSSPINHQLKSTTGIGGTIQTTSTGNQDGTLEHGTVIGPTTITTATGQHVVYTMTPEPGYRIGTVTVSNGTLDYADGSQVDVQEVLNTDGSVAYYTYAFTNIFEDNAIDVRWIPITQDITVSKQADAAGSFDFSIRASRTNPDSGATEYFDFSQWATPAGGNRYTFALGTNEQKTFPDLPYGYSYEIEELEKDGWRLVSIDGDTNATAATGTVDATSPDSVTHTFVNEREMGSVQLEKTFADTGFDYDFLKDDPFTFNVDLYQYDDQPGIEQPVSAQGVTIKDVHGDPIQITSQTESSLSFSMRADDGPVTIENIPVGTLCRVTEDLSSAPGWVMTDASYPNTPDGSNATLISNAGDNGTISIENAPMLPTGIEVEKKVEEDSLELWQDAADYDINQEVPFKVSVTIPPFHESLSDVLPAESYAAMLERVGAELVIRDSFNPDSFRMPDSIWPNISVSVNGSSSLSLNPLALLNNIPELNDEGSITYQINPVTLASTLENYGHHLGFEEVTLDFEYSLILNESCVVGPQGNENSAVASFEFQSAELDDLQSETDLVRVFTYAMRISKISDGGAPLSGAEFVIGRRKSNLPNDIEWLSADPYQNAQTYVVDSWVASIEDATKLPDAQYISSIPGEEWPWTFDIIGLDAQTTYIVREVTPPPGYQIANETDIRIESTYDIASDNPAHVDFQLAPGLTPNHESASWSIVPEQGLVWLELQNSRIPIDMPASGGDGIMLLQLSGLGTAALCKLAVSLRSARKRWSGKHFAQ